MTESFIKMSRVGPLRPFLPKMRHVLMEVFRRLGYLDCLQQERYVVIDTETTGVVASRDRPWQVAAVVWDAGQEVSVFNETISIPREAYDSCAPDIREKIHLTWERIEREGKPEKDVLSAFSEFMIREIPRGDKLALRVADLPVLGQNICFDLNMLSVAFSRAFGIIIDLKSPRFINVGAAVKAAQLGYSLYPTETAEAFLERVSNERAKAIYWAMDYCVTQLALPVREGDTHDALVDCRTVKMLVDAIMDSEYNPASGSAGVAVADERGPF